MRYFLFFRWFIVLGPVVGIITAAILAGTDSPPTSLYRDRASLLSLSASLEDPISIATAQSSKIQQPRSLTYVSVRRQSPRLPSPLFGLYLPEGPRKIGDYARVESKVDHHAAVVEWQADFTQSFAYVRPLLDRVARHGSLPMLTWEPWDNSDLAKRTFTGAPVNQRAYRLQAFLAGRHDQRLREYARGMKEFGRPLLLRFAPEMNGWWNCWSEKVNGNRHGEFVRVWRHVVGIFREEGAYNVAWIWSPNIGYEEPGLPAAKDLRHFYPGDAWVDIVGLDGYNWGTTQDWSKWHSFDEMFGPSLKRVRGFSDRPLFISETASTEQGGDKAAWIRKLFRELKRNPDIVGFVWFNRDKETDWRIESSAEALAAFRAGVQETSESPDPLIDYLWETR